MRVFVHLYLCHHHAALPLDYLTYLLVPAILHIRIRIRSRVGYLAHSYSVLCLISGHH